MFAMSKITATPAIVHLTSVRCEMIPRKAPTVRPLVELEAREFHAVAVSQEHGRPSFEDDLGAIRATIVHQQNYR